MDICPRRTCQQISPQLHSVSMRHTFCCLQRAGKVSSVSLQGTMSLTRLVCLLLFHCIQVVFKLHPSFAQPVRPVEGPSYELTETGWGEFDIGVEVGMLRTVFAINTWIGVLARPQLGLQPPLHSRVTERPSDLNAVNGSMHFVVLCCAVHCSCTLPQM